MSVENLFASLIDTKRMAFYDLETGTRRRKLEDSIVVWHIVLIWTDLFDLQVAPWSSDRCDES
jgi:hypothetical protein